MSNTRTSPLLERIGQLPSDRQLRVICDGIELLIERRGDTIIALRETPASTSAHDLLTRCADTSWQVLQINDTRYLCAWRRLPIARDDWLITLASALLNTELDKPATL